ncbi:MAG: sigma-70 family RNA polymerase sigma factor [bacterium]|nr:sigma-70 family RNA polymerase sigma factor [bacterium]
MPRSACAGASAVQDGASPEELLADLPAPASDPHHRIVLERLRDLAARLPERQAQVFTMRNFEQLSFAEIAAHLDISKNTARTSAHKALQKLREQMAPAKEERHVG